MTRGLRGLVASGLCLAALPALAGIDLTRWKLTLPVDADGNGRADEVPAEGARGLEPWFGQADDGSLVFRANAGGARTSANTAYARSELRELDSSGKPAAWDCMNSERSLEIGQRLMQTTTAKPQVTIGQIHDAKNDNLMLRYSGPAKADGVHDTGRIELLWNNASQRMLLDPAYTLGAPMQVRIELRQGVAKVRYRNADSGVQREADAAFDAAGIRGGCFFKAGLYIQACSRTDSSGHPNAQCAAKGWAEARYDAADAHAEVRIGELKLDAVHP